MQKKFGLFLLLFLLNLLPLHAQTNSLRRLDEAGLSQALNLSQTQENVTVTIERVYADASQLAFWYSVTGLDLPEGELVGSPLLNISLLRADGDWFATGAMHANLDTSQPDSWQGFTSYEHEEQAVTGQLEFKFRLDLRADDSYPFYIVPVDRASEFTGEFVGEIPEEYRYDFPYDLTYEFDLNLPILPAQLIIPPLAQESEGLVMRVESVRITPSQVRLDLCYDMPSTADWQADVELRIGDELVQMSSYGLKDLPRGNETYRCVYMNFDTLIPEDVTALEISVPYLKTSVPELPSPELLESAYALLAEHGIVAEYVIQNHGMSNRLISKPEDMSEETAYMLMYDALRERYEVHWRFIIPLEQP